MKKEALEQLELLNQEIKLKNQELSDLISLNYEKAFHFILYQFPWIETAEFYKFYGINLSKMNGGCLSLALGYEPEFSLQARFLEEDVKAQLIECDIKEPQILSLNAALRDYLPKNFLETMSKQKIYTYNRAEFNLHSHNFHK